MGQNRAMRYPENLVRSSEVSIPVQNNAENLVNNRADGLHYCAGGARASISRRTQASTLPSGRL